MKQLCAAPLDLMCVCMYARIMMMGKFSYANRYPAAAG